MWSLPAESRWRPTAQVRAAGLERGVHVGDLALDQLEFADRLPNCLRSWIYGTTASRHAAMMPVGRPTAPRVRSRSAHQHLHAAVELAEDVFFRHFDVLEHQLARVRAAHAELVELCATEKPFMPFSTMNAVMPRELASTSVFA